ncbi:MAG TPA: response regulator transcription factor [Candidatus Avoscillospira stercorigallinarum]|uniref:Stage 0 sporulation protein A homolog n=1 Tax=Candidatus Avoscillospira stercorigallinarum TaxID=2840708 RepID=A0A9D0Z9B9_9FIRM|nr:response regulator transcription factor [Candidatus Avoscillospira stercorigallinarum]
MTIYLVEDDATIAGAVASHLRAWGYDCVVAADFRDVAGEFQRLQPQLVLLDLLLPFYNGFHWCQEIRRTSQVPILFLSSASDNLNILTAIQMGGDDFLAKPFDLNILAAKVQALLRRAYDFAPPSDVLACGALRLNLSDGTVEQGGQRTTLTRNELKILQVLLENRGKIVSRDRLMERLWESDSFVDENTLTVNVNRLRKTLAAVGAGDLIVTRKKQGYLVP